MIKLRVSDLLDEIGINNKTALAAKLNTNRYTLVKHTNQPTTRIDLEVIEKYCKTLNVTPNDLFEITNEDGTPWKPSARGQIELVKEIGYGKGNNYALAKKRQLAEKKKAHYNK